MGQLSSSAKQAIVEKVLAKDSRTVTEIARVHQVGYSTLHKWIRRYRNNGVIMRPSRCKKPKPGPGKPRSMVFSISDRLQHLIATGSLDETAMGVYCRQHGFYSFQLSEWKDGFMREPDIEKKAMLIWGASEDD